MKEAKKEEAEKIDLVPAEPLLTTERNAKNLINEITDICSIAQTAFILPETTSINRSANFYVEDILRAFKEYNIIE